MKTIKQLEEIAEVTGHSLHELMYKELSGQNDEKLNAWLDIMIDYCNNWDGRFEFFPEMMKAMIEDDYEPTWK